MSKRTFVYDAKRAEKNARHHYLTATRVHAAKASAVGVQRLCEYLRSSAPKSEEDWSAIADLIEWFEAQLHQRRGRPKGWVRDQRQEARLCMAFLVRDGKRGYGKRIRQKKVVRPQDNVEDRLIKRAIKLVEREYPKMPDKIEVYELRKFKARLPQWVTEYVCDFMSKAREEMRSLGQGLRDRQPY